MKTKIFCGHTFNLPDEIADLYGHDEWLMNKVWLPTPDDICVDIGCGPGTWTLSALAKGAKCLTFDPREYSIQLLTKAIAANPQLAAKSSLHPFGLWSSNTLLGFDEPQSRIDNSQNKIAVVSLDTFVEDWDVNRIDFINMDVEAAEIEVLKGAKRTIAKLRPIIIVEVHTSMGVDAQNVANEIGKGYEFSFVSGMLVAKPLNRLSPDGR